MVIDLVMGIAALTIGLWLGVCSSPLADHMLEGDTRIRDRHPWVEAYEPQRGPLATADGRWRILRGWLVLSALAFALVGGGLVLRALGL